VSRFKKGDSVWVKGEFDCVDEGDVGVDFTDFQGACWHAFFASDDIIPRTGDAPQATGPAHVVSVNATRSATYAPDESTGQAQSITLVTAAGHRLELAPWVIDALRQELVS
jgi:hypothetical protein